MTRTSNSTKLVTIVLCLVFMVVSDAAADVGVRTYDSSPGNEKGPDEIETTAEPQSADLALDRFSPDGISSPSVPIFSGQRIGLGTVVRNIGDAESDSFILRYYVGDILLHTQSQDPLGSWEHRRVSADVTIPHDISLGSYAFRIEAICANDHDYFGGENDSSTYDYNFFRSQPPGLEIDSIHLNTTICGPGDSVNVMVDIVSGKCYVDVDAEYVCEFYALADLTLFDDAYHLGTHSGSISPKEEERIHKSCQFPVDTPEDAYHIVVLLTWKSKWQSDDESKRREGSSSDTVWVGRCPNLEVTSVEPVEGTYGPGEEISVYSLVENIGDIASGPYTVNFYASVDTTISTNDYHLAYVDRSSLEPGAQHSTNTKCHFPANIREGTYYIGAIVQPSELESDTTNNKACSSMTVDVVPSARYVSGQMQYKNYKRYPIRYALVKIYEDDHHHNPLGDPVVMETYTDDAGYFGILLPEEENVGQDIYVRVFTEVAENAYPETTSRICTVKDDVFSETYFMESPPYPYPQEAALVINMTASDNEGDGEFMVYDSIVEGFHQAKTYFGIELAEMTTFWPSAEGSYYDPCDLTIHIAQDDRRDRDVIMHEYGHYVADSAGFAQGSVGDNPYHYWDQDLRHQPVARTDEEARNLAFREAWPTLFSIATQHGDTWNYWEDTEYQDWDEASGDLFSVDLEEDTADHDSPGEFYGNMNCCALWDIYDNYDYARDDHDVVSDVTLAKIWTVCREYQPDDIIDFWNGWIHRFPDEQPEDVMRIFLDHEMLFAKPEPIVLPNTAPVVIAGEDQTVNQTHKGGAIVRLDASRSYDPDGDPLTYWWYTDEWRTSTGGSAETMTTGFSVGETTVTLEVFDGHVYVKDTVTITVLPTAPEDWIY